MSRGLRARSGPLPASTWAPRYVRSVAAYCWRCWRRRLGAWVATAAAVAAVLSLAAGAELFLVLSERSLDRQAQSASELDVFLDDAAQPDQVHRLQASIAALPGVRSVDYRSKAEALRAASQDESLASIARATSANPFPASLVVRLADPSASGRVTALAVLDPAADHDVPTSYTPAQGRRLSTFLSAARIVVAGVAAGALGVAGLVALVLLRGEIRARRSELRVLALVGTPRPVIRLPILVEAISLALAGSVLAIVSLAYAGGHLVPAANVALPFLRLGSAADAVQAIGLVTISSSVAVLGACSLLVRLPR